MKNQAKNEKSNKRTLFLGNYGYPPNLPPPKINVTAAAFIEDKLDKYVEMLQTISWAEQKLEIIARMLEDRNEQHLSNELKNITQKFTAL